MFSASVSFSYGLYTISFFFGGGGCIMWTCGLPVNRLPTPRPLYYIKDPDHAETGLAYTQCFAVVQVFPGNCKAVLSFLCVLYKAGASLTDCILWNARRILQRHQENCIHIYYSGNMYITLLRTKKRQIIYSMVKIKWFKMGLFRWEMPKQGPTGQSWPIMTFDMQHLHGPQLSIKFIH